MSCKEGFFRFAAELSDYNLAQGLTIFLLEASANLLEVWYAGVAKNTDEDILISASTLGSCIELIGSKTWIHFYSVLTT